MEAADVSAAVYDSNTTGEPLMHGPGGQPVKKACSCHGKKDCGCSHEDIFELNFSGQGKLTIREHSAHQEALIRSIPSVRIRRTPKF